MSRRAACSVSESINGVARRGRFQVWLEGGAVDHVDWPLEQSGDILFETDVIVNRSFSPWLEFHQDIKIAVGAIVGASNRTEHCRVSDTTRAQGRLVTAQRGNGI